MTSGFICFLITSLTYGGAENQLMRLAIGLKQRGWDVRVVTLKPPVAYRVELESAGISVHSLNIQKKLPDPRPIIHLVRFFWSWRPSILHSFMVHANLLARLVRPLSPVPVLICSARNTNEGGRFRELLYRLTDPLCDLTTQVSRAGMERYVKVKAVPKNKILYVPNGVDTDRYRPDSYSRKRLRETLGCNDAFTWLAAGRFYPQKDYPNLLQAFALIAEKRNDARLILVGDGPLRGDMETLARDLGLMNRVMFLGIRRDMPELMNAADGYVMSSAWEGMANVLLEASSTGLAIVATDVGGNCDVVQDGKTGLLVPSGDHVALAFAMARLMDMPTEERQRFGDAGRQYIEANYSLDHVVDIWEAIYREKRDVR